MNTSQTTSRWLMRLGILLFFLALLTGLLLAGLSNPRMGSASHVAGMIAGTFLVVLGLILPKLRFSRAITIVVFWLAIYGSYVAWATRLAAAVWGAGSSLMPISGLGKTGTPFQEGIIMFGAMSLALVMIVMCILVFWGLRGTDESRSKDAS